MIEQLIQMNNVSDLEKYVVLLKKFNFCGTVTMDRLIIDAYEILDITLHCPDGHVPLSINTCFPEDVQNIKNYLQESGLAVNTY